MEFVALSVTIVLDSCNLETSLLEIFFLSFFRAMFVLSNFLWPSPLTSFFGMYCTLRLV